MCQRISKVILIYSMVVLSDGPWLGRFGDQVAALVFLFGVLYFYFGMLEMQSPKVMSMLPTFLTYRTYISIPER